MTDLTRQEEREMIEKAKAGDPEANYQMSFWALEQAAAEPGEERWNKLAAKCLVKAAQAGYEPAKKHMAQLLRELEAQEPAEAAPVPAQEEPLFRPVDVTEEPAPPHEKKPAEKKPAGRRAAVAAAGGSGFAALGKSITEKASGFVSGLKDGSFGKSAAEMSEDKWKKIQLMCIIACVVLAFLIVLMLVTGKDSGAKKEEVAMPTPAAAEPMEVTPSPSPLPYPDLAVKEAIEGAELDIFPEEGDFVSRETTATLTVNSGLNLRAGPASSYGQIVVMDPDAQVGVYAIKNGWALVLYEEDTWGWCSEDYLRMN